MFCAPLLLLPLVVLAPSKADSDRMAAPLPRAFVSLAEGRMTLVSDTGIQGYMGFLGNTPLAPRGMVQVAATGEVELSWTGRGSLTARGSAAIGWEGSPFDSEPLRLPEFTDVQLEARSGELAVLLPGGVLLVAERAAVELKQRSSGVFGVHQVAGEPVLVVVPAPGAPEVREVTTGQWLWIDPMDYLGRSRFAFPGPDPVEEQQVFAAAKQGSLGYRGPSEPFASGDQPWRLAAPSFAGGWPAGPAVPAPLALPFAFDGMAPPQVRIAPFVLEEPKQLRAVATEPVVIPPFDLGPPETEDDAAPVEPEVEHPEAPAPDQGIAPEPAPQVEDLLEAGDALLEALLAGGLPAAAAQPESPSAPRGLPWSPDTAMEPIESPLRLEAWEPLTPAEPRTAPATEWVHPEGWRGFPYRLPNPTGASDVLAAPSAPAVQPDASGAPEDPATAEDFAAPGADAGPVEPSAPQDEPSATSADSEAAPALSLEELASALFERDTSQRSLRWLRAAGARLDEAFQMRQALSALFEQATRRDS